MRGLIDALRRERVLPRAELAGLIREISDGDMPYLFDAARETARSRFGNRIYTRGLIEFTNYCRCDCYYCGIRRSNRQTERYRLTQEEILACCRAGYALGFRTFVLQGGEDPYFTDERICELVRAVKSSWPDCAVTLSIGEKEHSSYRIVICCGMRLPRPRITGACIRRSRRPSAAGSAFGRSRSLATRSARASWSARRIRRRKIWRMICCSFMSFHRRWPASARLSRIIRRHFPPFPLERCGRRF